MTRCIDGFLIVLKKSQLNAYKKDAALGHKVWMEHGALDYCEGLAADLTGMFGLPFTKLCKLKANETVMFSFITYKSRAHRKEVNAKVMKDPRMEKPFDMKLMPFDVKRFSMGTFQELKVASKAKKKKK
jgi:uncharacterized protein YbaA (DUF1428 family)